MCGCTDLDCSQCIEASGEPCHWVDSEQQICSRCYLNACERDLTKEDFEILKKAVKSQRNFDLDEDEDFQSCSNCDLPDACADFGCAIKAGLKSPNDFW